MSYTKKDYQEFVLLKTGNTKVSTVDIYLDFQGGSIEVVK